LILAGMVVAELRTTPSALSHQLSAMKDSR
jgi:hypothetical protein